MSKFFNVHVHIETYVPPQFGIRENGAHLAVGGYGRNVAAAKYSDWVRIRKTLEKLRPPSVTELLLSNDGNQILEGCVTNFFVVCRKDSGSDDGNVPYDYGNKNNFEVQTAPINDGVLPGIIRQLVLEVCRNEGIPFREVAPSWSKHEIWEEAFITSSLRLLQHVDSIQVPTEWQSAHSKTWKDISWTKKQFQVGGPGMITTLIQEKVVEKAILEGYSINWPITLNTGPKLKQALLQQVLILIPILQAPDPCLKIVNQHKKFESHNMAKGLPSMKGTYGEQK
ncbi:hypothetical protein TSUD_46520 [Trifolium subterraneum]|uniref:Uncharacterized protein n=1 Tax=Trifolium subterraneum TaxID=3900 RepID=A0A2Z6ME84_TRISU|nr:hypothetical protein TSUD_46520 [Trifolium subterraneum]